jgi:hypothetical protein
MHVPESLPYTVRTDDTLWSIAERFYGHGGFWPRIAERNPLARAGVLYEGQRLELPPPPEAPPNSPALRPALPLRHAPVRLRFDGRQPLFRYVGFGVGGTGGFAGELTFTRAGAPNLGELSAGRLMQYRHEQIAWAVELFLERIVAPALHSDWPLYTTRTPAGPRITLRPCEIDGPGYTITGRIGEWQQVSVHEALVGGGPSYAKMLAVNPAALFRTASLVLADADAPAGGVPERSVPLGRVLRAACPHLIPPAALWMLAPGEPLALPQLSPARPAPPTQPAAGLPGANGAAPPRRAKRKKAAKKDRRQRPAPGEET